MREAQVAKQMPERKKNMLKKIRCWSFCSMYRCDPVVISEVKKELSSVHLEKLCAYEARIVSICLLLLSTFAFEKIPLNTTMDAIVAADVKRVLHLHQARYLPLGLQFSKHVKSVVLPEFFFDDRAVLPGVRYGRGKA